MCVCIDKDEPSHVQKNWGTAPETVRLNRFITLEKMNFLLVVSLF